MSFIHTEIVPFSIGDIKDNSIELQIGPIKIVADITVSDRGIKLNWPRNVFVGKAQNDEMRRVAIAAWARRNELFKAS